jgi:hypothetical protein
MNSFDRRSLLAKLAASGAIVGAGSTVTATTAFADSGTEACRHSFTTAPSVQIIIGRDVAFGSNDEFFRLTQTALPAGTCPCGGTATITYSYRVRFFSPNNTNQAITTQNNLASLTTGQVQLGFTVGGSGVQNWNYDIELGVYLSCPGRNVTPAVRCRFVRVTGQTALAAQNGVPQTIGTFALTTVTPVFLATC